MKRNTFNTIGRVVLLPALFVVLFAVDAMAQRYPENGENLLSSYMTQATGHHEIVVQNNSGHDAIVKVEDHFSGETYRLVFVRKGYTYTIEDVRDGTFMLKFALGSDYSPTQKMFLKPVSFTKFDYPDTLRSSTTSNGYQTTINYDQMSITLAPVVGGNANTTKISARDF